MRSRLGGVLTTVLAVVALFLLVGWALTLIPDDDLGPGDLGPDGPASPATSISPAPASRAPASALTVSGLGDLVADVREASGSSRVFEAVLYPGYAVLSLPVDRETRREQRYRWDGDLDALDSFGRSPRPWFDLAAVDPRAVVLLSQRARERLVEDATSWYVIVRAPDDDGAQLWAYASNKYGEGGYLAATPRGKVVRRVTW